MDRTTDETLQGYDVIGDVHGHLDALEGLLARLDYARVDGTWRHPSRQAVFVGDLIDRGSHQVEVEDPERGEPTEGLRKLPQRVL